jgi:hypothetical protein
VLCAKTRAKCSDYMGEGRKPSLRSSGTDLKEHEEQTNFTAINNVALSVKSFESTDVAKVGMSSLAILYASA